MTAPRPSPTSSIFALIEDQIEHLAEFGEAAAAAGHTGETAILIFIEVDGPLRALVDLLMPGYDWTPIRALGGPAIAGGISLRAPCVRAVSEAYPSLAAQLAKDPPPGNIHVVILLNRQAGVAYVNLPPPAASVLSFGTNARGSA